MPRVTVVVSATIVAVLAAALGVAHAQERPVPRFDGNESQVTDLVLTATHAGPALVIDRDDPETYYAVAQELQAGECRAYVSTDAGDTWTSHPGPDPAPARCQSGEIAPRWGAQADLQQGADGTLYYGYHASNGETEAGRSVYVARSSDAGQTWTNAVLREAAATEEGGLSELNMQPRLAVDPDDPEVVYATWLRTANFPPPDSELDAVDFQPYFAISTDGGETFGDGQRIGDELHLSFEAPDLAVSRDAIHVIATTAGRRGEDEPPPSRVVELVSTDGGETFEETVIATAPATGAPSIAADLDGGAVHAVWMSNQEGNVNVYHAASIDGAAWTDPIRLNDDDLALLAGHYHPTISRAPNGRVDVAWYDYRHDPSPVVPIPEDADEFGLYRNFDDWASVHAVSSSDEGQTWSVDHAVTGDTLIDRTLGVWSPDFFVLDPPAVASTDERAVFAWTDTRNGNADTSTQDIFARTLAFGDTSQAAGEGFGLAEVLLVLAGLGIGAGIAFLLAARRLRSTV